MSYFSEWLSTLRTMTGYDQPISGTVVNTDDPLQIGRIQICPDTFDPSKVKEEDCPWCHVESSNPQTWHGQSVHTDWTGGVRPGHRVDVQFSPDGTGRMTRTHTTMTKGDSPAGSATLVKGDWTYPSNSTEQA